MATTHFNCFATRSQVEDYVKETGNYHAYNGKLYIRDSDGSVRAKALKPYDHYISAVSIDDVTKTLDLMSKMKYFRDKFPCLHNYSFEVMLPGTKGSIECKLHEDSIWWGGKLVPTFFDGELFCGDEISCFCKVDGVRSFRHSGDITSNGYFMHSMKMTERREGVFLVAAVGYAKNPLYKYENQAPFIVLLDHVKKVAFAVPFSLDRGTIGDSMLIAPLIFSTKNGRLRYYIPNSCPTDQNVNTSEYTPKFKKKVMQVTANFERAYAECKDPYETQASLQPQTSHAFGASSSQQQQPMPEFSSVIFVQEGLHLPDRFFDKTSAFASFGVSLTVCRPGFESTSYVKSRGDKRPPIILPLWTGEAHGHSSLALAKPCTTSWLTGDAWIARLQECDVVVHARPDDWNESALQSMLKRVNGLMIIHLQSIEVYKDRLSRIRQLTDLKLTCVRMMGAQSFIVLIDVKGTCCFYRGILHGMTPSFADVLDIDEVLRLIQDGKAWKRTVVDVDNSQIVLPCGSTTTFCSAQTWLKEQVATGSIESFRDVFAQISVVASSAQIDALKEELSGIVIQKAEANSKKYGPTLKAAINALQKRVNEFSSDAKEDLHTWCQAEYVEVLRLKELTKTDRGPMNALIREIDSLCSFKVTSSRSTGLQQAERKAAVKANVERANNLTISEFAEEMSETTFGFAVARVDTNLARRMLMAVSNNTMEKYMQEMLTEPLRVVRDDLDHFDPMLQKIDGPFSMNASCISITPETVEALLGMESNDTGILSSSGFNLTFQMQGFSHLAIPCFKSSERMDGSYVDFMSIANEPSIANYRVLLRGMLSKLNSRIPINAASKDLTFAIQLIVLSFLHSIVVQVRDIDRLEETSTHCQLIRSLVYFWATVAASGQTPVTFAFQLLQPGSKIQLPKMRGEWSIYALVAIVYPYTKLPQHALTSNIRQLLVKAIRKALVADVVSTLLKKEKKEMDENQRLGMNMRNIALRWNGAACNILHRADPNHPTRLDISDLKSASEILLGVFPSSPTYTSNKLKPVLVLVNKQRFDDIDWNQVRIIVACAVFKRSAIFAAAKKKAKNSIARQKSLDGYLKEEAHCGARVIDQKQNKCNKFWVGPSQVKMQNQAACVSNISAQMLGDAEINRIPWRVNEDLIEDGLSDYAFMQYVLPKFSSLVPEPSTPNDVARTDKECQVDIVSDFCSNDTKDAYKLWMRCDSIPAEDLDREIPTKCVRVLMHSIGITTPSNVSIAIGKVVRSLLTDYRSDDQGLLNAVEVLHSLTSGLQQCAACDVCHAQVCG